MLRRPPPQRLCDFGEVFSTDVRIHALRLTVLEDDKRFFSNYGFAPVLQRSVWKQCPQPVDRTY